MSPIGLLMVIAAVGAEADPAAALSTQPGRQAVERGLVFLEEDAVKWRQKHNCVTCHHGVMTVWALGEARQQGYAIAAETWADLAGWTLGDNAEILRTRIIPAPPRPADPPPQYHVVSLAAVYFAQAARSMPDLDAPAREQLDRLPGHVAAFQKADGSWSAEEFPAGNRPPPTQESPEVLTLWAYLALEPFAAAEAAPTSPARASRTRAEAWLGAITPGDTTQVAALRLLTATRAGAGNADAIDRLLKRQHADGGWSQVKDLEADAYATGQALYALAQAGLKADRPEVRRAVAFLVASQRADGSWPMIPRAHPGAKPFKETTAIDYFGSAWAVLGLVRSVPQSD